MYHCHYMFFSFLLGFRKQFFRNISWSVRSGWFHFYIIMYYPRSIYTPGISIFHQFFFSSQTAFSEEEPEFLGFQQASSLTNHIKSTRQCSVISVFTLKHYNPWIPQASFQEYIMVCSKWLVSFLYYYVLPTIFIYPWNFNIPPFIFFQLKPPFPKKNQNFLGFNKQSRWIISSPLDSAVLFQFLHWITTTPLDRAQLLISCIDKPRRLT